MTHHSNKDINQHNAGHHKVERKHDEPHSVHQHRTVWVRYAQDVCPVRFVDYQLVQGHQAEDREEQCVYSLR